jgi:hypothetical protein
VGKFIKGQQFNNTFKEMEKLIHLPESQSVAHFILALLSKKQFKTF